MEDAYDIAYKRGWQDPKLRQLVYLCYKTPDFSDNARRFYASPEFVESIHTLSKLGKSPTPSISVLDFACGNGIASYALARCGYSVTGVDSSLGKLAGLNAAQRLQGLDEAKFNLIHSTGENLDFADNTFDIVWIREALHHIHGLDKFLREVKRVLKTDGIVCSLREVVIWNESQREHFFASHPFHPITQDENCYYLSDYVTAFESNDLKIEEILYPHSSIVNSFPNAANPDITFDANIAKQRKEGYDLFSFFARKTIKPHPTEVTGQLNPHNSDQALGLLDQVRCKAQPDSTVSYKRVASHIHSNQVLGSNYEIEKLFESDSICNQAQSLPIHPELLPQSGNLPSNRVSFKYGENFYGTVLLNPTTLARIASSPELWVELLSFHGSLATDEYVRYLDHYYRAAIHRFGSHWWYFDIANILFAASKVIQPRNYLEIGVRRGRSTCIVARACPTVNIFAFDMWIQNYAGMENPGPDFVRSELSLHGHTGDATFIDGDSHQTVKKFFQENPELQVDMITVDGDHSELGAFLDLCDVIPHLSVGGVIVFDDISHPEHPYLFQVWKKTLDKFPYLASFEFTETGYGVAFAIRR